jgi:superfamily II DNA or RNA helicase
MKLRDYQEECLEILKQVKEGSKSLVMSSVGSGKTVIFSSLAANCGGRVLIVTPSTELREQAEEKLKSIDPDAEIGSVQADLDDVHAKIVVSTRQSLTHPKSERLKRMLKHGEFEYLIVDECHQAPKQIHKIIKQINKNIKVVGFSATPYTKECVELFGQPIFRRSILDMIDAEYLVEPYAILIKSKTNISHVKTNNGDFIQGELEKAVNNAERNRLIIESYKKYCFERKLTLVFAAGCDHGKELLKEFRAEGIPCEYVDGETSKEQRKSIIEKFKKKEIKVLINVLALSTGFDVPETDSLIICRPTKSRILYEQIVGRGLRLAEEKTDCQIIDIQDITKRHDLMNIDTIFETKMRSGERLSQARKRIEEEQLAEKRRQEELEQKRIEAELQRQKQIEIEAQRIKLINRDMKLGFENRKYDWFRVNNVSQAITYAMNKHYVIESVYDEFVGDNVFIVYNVSTDKGNKYAEYMDKKANLVDAIDYVEKQIKLNTYTDPKAQWKSEPPTEGQLKFCSWAKSKREASVYFSSGNIASALKKHKIS